MRPLRAPTWVLAAVPIAVAATAMAVATAADPPATPPPPAVVAAARVAPHAALIGLYEPCPPGPGPVGETVIGKILLDAGASRSERPIRWRWSGPALVLAGQSSISGPPNASAVAYVARPGLYRFQAVAVGHDERGEPDADAAMWVVAVGGEPGPAPPGPGPSPGPSPPPRPVEPDRPFPTRDPRPFPAR